jgi:hypothetical protein
MAVMNTEASRVILRTSNASRGQSVLEKCRQLRDLISGRLLAEIFRIAMAMAATCFPSRSAATPG